MVAFGDAAAQFRVYLPQPPAMEAYQQLNSVLALSPGEIEQIYRHCGNGWRKIFNVYAKLLCSLPTGVLGAPCTGQSWQQYRDQQLLQAGSGTALCFSAPQLPAPAGCLHLIAGRTHARQLLATGMTAELHWLNTEFAVDPQRRLLVTPFFDYRQLNNAKIQLTARLLQLIRREAPLPQFAAALHTSSGVAAGEPD